MAERSVSPEERAVRLQAAWAQVFEAHGRAMAESVAAADVSVFNMEGGGQAGLSPDAIAEAVRAGGGLPPGTVAFNCLGSAGSFGTYGTLTGCLGSLGSAGTFGSHEAQQIAELTPEA